MRKISDENHERQTYLDRMLVSKVVSDDERLLKSSAVKEIKVFTQNKGSLVMDMV